MTAPEMDVTPDERKQMNEDLNKLEFLARGMHFDRLMELATEVCLTKQLPPLEGVPDPLSLDRRLVNNVGALGLRTALEIDMGIEKYPNYQHGSYSEPTEEEQIADHEAKKDKARYKRKQVMVYMRLDTPLKHPDVFIEPADDSIIRRAEQFGKALIDEAFVVLGHDATAYVEKMRSDDVEQQLLAIDWLAARINSIHRRGKAAELGSDPRVESDDMHDSDPENKAYHMHPAHLSPKLMGIYPTVELKPTCLMASILAASFFEKAGTEYMHAGVAVSSYAGQLREAADLLDKVVAELEDEKSVDQISQALIARSALAQKAMKKDPGYHAAVYAKISNDTWWQVDPYSGFVINSPPFRDKEIEDVYQTLKEFEPTAPHLELGLDNNNMTLEAVMRNAFIHNRIAKLDDDEVATAVGLLMDEEESAPQKIYETVFVPYLRKVMEDNPDTPIALALNRLFGETFADDPREKFAALMETAYYNVFNKYVLWDQHVDDVHTRVQDDQSYRLERMADIARIPRLWCASMALLNTEQNIFKQYHHDAAELGLPHVRIGMSVLMDFATYCDDALPPTFWMTHWPSLIPITETMQHKDHNEVQQEKLRNMAILTKHRALTYIKSHHIVKEFLSAYEQDKENKSV